MWQPGLAVVLLFLNSVGASSEEATTESMHILLPPHELGLMEIYADSIVHYPNGCFVNVVGIHTALTWTRGRARRLDTVRSAEREGKLNIQAD